MLRPKSARGLHCTVDSFIRRVRVDFDELSPDWIAQMDSMILFKN
jgi:hypothetical protein